MKPRGLRSRRRSRRSDLHVACTWNARRGHALAANAACAWAGRPSHVRPRKPYLLRGSEQRLTDDRRDALSKVLHVALAVGVDAVGEQDEVAAVQRVDPEHRAGVAGVAERRAARESLAAAARKARVDVEPVPAAAAAVGQRSEEHTSELQSQSNLVCRLLLEKKK